NYQLAWTADGQLTAQARNMIQALEDSDKAGLRADDYDGPRWEDRVAHIQPGSTPWDLARFDVALTVSAMRYLADVHSGRISPKYFKFGLDVRHKRYDLADFLRSRVVAATNAAPMLAEVEPPYPGYQRPKMGVGHSLGLEKGEARTRSPRYQETNQPR